MADIKLTLGADGKPLRDEVQKVEEHLAKAGEAAKGMGEKIHKATEESETDMGGLGNKSQRAAASIAQVGMSLGELAKGEVSLYSLVSLSREAEHVTFRLEQSVLKLGKQYEGLASKLGTIGGFIGPAGLIIAGATVAYSLWKAIAKKQEEGLKHLEEQKKAIEEIVKQTKLAESAQRDLNDAMLPADQQAKVKQLREMQQEALRALAGEGGALNPALMESLTGRARAGAREKFDETKPGKEVGGAKGLDKHIEEVGEKTKYFAEEIAKWTKESIGPGIKELEGKFDKYSKELGKLLDLRKNIEDAAHTEAVKTLHTALTDTKATREMYEQLGIEEKKLVDAITTEIKAEKDAEDLKKKQIEEQEKLNKDRMEKEKADADRAAQRSKELSEDLDRQAKEWDDVMGRALEYVDASMLKGSETIGEAVATAIQKLADAGWIPIAQAKDAELDLLRRFNQKLSDAHPGEGLPAFTQALKDEIAIRQKAIDIEKQLLGSHQVISGQAQGAAGGGGAARGGAGGGEGLGGGGAAAGGGAGDGPPRGFNANLAELRKKKLEEVGGPLRPDEQKALRDTAKFMADKQTQEQRDAMDEKHRTEWEKIKGEAGPGGVDPRKRDQFQRRISKETRGMEQDMARERKQDAQQGDGSKDVKQSMQDANQNAQQLQQGQAEFVGEVAATFQSIAAAFQNLNTINAGGTTAVRSSRQSLPGSGTRR